ncbi:MAG: hypothetical protein F7C81_05045 [Desulfurococcales archaeon]|nr:hypothetical protein [Desulfurococcales archaeon]
MPRSPVAKLADAVNWLEAELKKLDDETRGSANEILKLADMLARELSNDIKITARMAIEEAEEAERREAERLETEYRRRVEEQITMVRDKASKNIDKAVEAVIEELKKLIAGG